MLSPRLSEKVSLLMNENSEIAPQSSQGEHSDENLVLGLEEQLESLTINNPTLESMCSIVQEPSMPLLPTGPGIWPNDFLLVEGKYIHKASFCWIFFNSLFKAKLLDWLCCVRGCTSINKLRETGDISLLDNAESIFVAGSPFLTLVQFNDQTAALAFLCSTSILENGLS